MLLSLLSFQAIAGTTVKYLRFEEAAVAAAKKWRETGKATPIVSDDGRVLFPYGQYQPTVVCSIYRACDIALEPGEVVVGKPSAGDASLWDIKPAFSGEEESMTQHIVLKAKELGLETNLILRTNRRVYALTIKSVKESDYMGMVGFYYPEEMVDSWEKIAKQELEKKKKVVAALAPGGLDKIDLDYSIEGDATWKPRVVFNDGVKTYIQFPKTIETAEMPTLALSGEEGDDLIVNQRMKSSTLLEVDQLFERGVLLLGKNGKVEIKWNRAPVNGNSTTWSSWWK